MPSVAIFIGGYCRIGSPSCGGGFKGLSLVNRELNCAFRILALSGGRGVLQDSIFFKSCDAY